MKSFTSHVVLKACAAAVMVIGTVGLAAAPASAASYTYVDGPYSSLAQCRAYRTAMLKDDSSLHPVRDCYRATYNFKMVWYWQYWS